MNTLGSKNQAQGKVKKAGRKVRLAVQNLSPEELLNSLADIIIERITEENEKSRSLTQPSSTESSQL